MSYKKVLFLGCLIGLSALFGCSAVTTEDTEKKDFVTEVPAKPTESLVEQTPEPSYDELNKEAGEDSAEVFEVLFKDYNGEKIQSIFGPQGENYSPAVCDSVIFYRAKDGETMQDILVAMKSELLRPLTYASENRPFTVLDYDVSKQSVVEISENCWLLPYLEGTYRYEGTDFVSMQTRCKEEVPDEQGRVSFFRQGSDEAFEFILMKKGNVYRLQRKELMQNVAEIDPNATQTEASKLPESPANPTAEPTVPTIIAKKREYLKESVTYERVEIGDHEWLAAVDKKGWLIDLDGDGTEEKLYLGSAGLYINDLLVRNKGEISLGRAYGLWILDIDRTDGKYELMMLSDEIVRYQDGELQRVKTELSMLQGGMKNPIWDFVREDDATIVFCDWIFVFDSYPLVAKYRLDEGERLAIVPMEYELETPQLFAYVNEEKELKLFKERDENGAYEPVKGIRLFHLTKSDGVNWVYLESPYYESGWIFCEWTTDGRVINHELQTEDFVGFNPLP